MRHPTYRSYAVCLLILFGLTLNLPAQSAENELRTWASFSGSTVEARLIGAPDSKEVVLELTDGSRRTVEVRLLSEGDQGYLKERALIANSPRRVLFIGNSYTSRIRDTFKEMVAASPFADCQLFFITPGGKTLAYHLENELTMQLIQLGNWDRVVLQDQSQTPAVFPNKFDDAADDIDRIIDKSGAQTVFYETWGRRDGDQQNLHLFPDYKRMQKALSKAYQKAARSCDATLAPVGQVWAEVEDLDSELWYLLYAEDGSHPAQPGNFLAASVFYAVLFNADPAELDFDAGLPAEQVRTIQKAVTEVVFE